MPTKPQAFAQLAEDTATRLTSSLANWTGFLSTVGRLYKYPYHEPVSYTHLFITITNLVLLASIPAT